MADNRLYAYDFVRSIAIVFVIAVHALMVVDGVTLIGNIYQTAFRTLFFTGNSLFFLMSGKFNLKIRNSETLLCSYYYRKFRNIGIPLFVVFFLRTLYDMYPNYSIGSVLKNFAVNFLSEYGHIEYWFVFALFGFLLVAPFFANIFANITDWQAKWFLILGFGYQGILTILANMGINFGWGFPIAGWCYMFCLGGFIDRYFSSKKIYRLLIVGGLLSWLLSFCASWLGYSYGVNDLSPLFVVLSLGVYAFLLKNAVEKTISPVVSFIAKHSFSIYLCHMVVLLAIAPYFLGMQLIGMSAIGAHIAATLITLIVSLGIAVVLDEIVIRYAKKIFDVIAKALSRVVS